MADKDSTRYVDLHTVTLTNKELRHAANALTAVANIQDALDRPELRDELRELARKLRAPLHDEELR